MPSHEYMPNPIKIEYDDNNNRKRIIKKKQHIIKTHTLKWPKRIKQKVYKHHISGRYYTVWKRSDGSLYIKKSKIIHNKRKVYIHNINKSSLIRRPSYLRKKKKYKREKQLNLSKQMIDYLNYIDKNKHKKINSPEIKLLIHNVYKMRKISKTMNLNKKQRDLIRIVVKARRYRDNRRIRMRNRRYKIKKRK